MDDLGSLMPGRLERIHIGDFRGGLNMRRSEFLLGEDESPGMLNVEIDPRRGFYARKGVDRVNNADIDYRATFDPRHAVAVEMAAGVKQAYVTHNGKVWASETGVSYSDMGISAAASPHLADFAVWGDYTYIVCGNDGSSPSYRMNGVYDPGVNDPVSLTQAESGSWNDDYTVPAGIGSGNFPQANLICTHKGYIFVANTEEGGTGYPNRLRWSHPLNPEDWAEEDYTDLLGGGGKITALLSFGDVLLIFKNESVWQLTGEDTFSFQFEQVDSNHGVVHPAAVTRSASAVYFYTPQEGGRIHAYSGSYDYRQGGTRFVELSEPIHPIMDEITLSRREDVFLGWGAQKLWVSVPWNDDPLTSVTVPGAAAFDGTGDYLSAANTASLDITSNYCVVVRARSSDWANGVEQTFFETGDGLGFTFQTTTDGYLATYLYNGSGYDGGQSTALITSYEDDWQWFAVTADVDQAGVVYKFWVGGTGDVPSWSQLGSDVNTVGPETINTDSFNGHIGGRSTGARMLTGDLSYVAVYDGIGDNSEPGLGTKVLHVDGVDFALAKESGVGDGETFEAYTGQTVTSNGDITYTGSAGLNGHQNTLMIFDPEVGNGAWYRYQPAKGYFAVPFKNASTIADGEMWVVVAGDTAAVVAMDALEDASDVIFEGDAGRYFDVYYRTGWRFAGEPEQRKSWRRPRFVMPTPTQDAAVDVLIYADYETSDFVRQHTLNVTASDGLTYWDALGSSGTYGFDWGDGSTWGNPGANGAQINRAQLILPGQSGLGVWSAVQLRFAVNKEDSTGSRWGMNNITLKVRSRKATT